MSWTVTPDSIQALKNLSSSLKEHSDSIHREVNQLHEFYDMEKDGLGAHAAEIWSLLEAMGVTEQEASTPVKKLVLKLPRAANLRQAHIDTQRYSGRSR